MPLFKDRAKKLVAEIRTVRNFKACTFVEPKTEQDEQNFISHVQHVLGFENSNQGQGQGQAQNQNQNQSFMASNVVDVNSVRKQSHPQLDHNNNDTFNQHPDPGLNAFYGKFNELSITGSHSSSASQSYKDSPYNENPEDALSNFNRKWSLTSGLSHSRRKSVEPEEQINQLQSLDDYHLLKVVGKGAFGKVLLVQCRTSGQFHAMKVLEKKTILQTNNMKGVLNEKRILQCIQFPFLVQLHHHFKDAMNLYMLMEFVGGGDLFFHLRRKLHFTERESQFYGGQIVLAIEYLHSLGIVFRDLKPENILINYDGYIKLTDFGLAKRLSGLGRTKTMLGTAEYLAPEIFLQKPYGKSVDWWAVGILLFEMVHGRSPFRSSSDAETFEKIISGKVKFGQTSTNFRNLVSHLLQEDPSKRFGAESADDIRNHPWFEPINWKMLLEKRLEAPYIPRLRHRGDTRFFDKYPDDFTELRHVPTQAHGVYKDCFVDF